MLTRERIIRQRARVIECRQHAHAARARLRHSARTAAVSPIALGTGFVTGLGIGNRLTCPVRTSRGGRFLGMARLLLPLMHWL